MLRRSFFMISLFTFFLQTASFAEAVSHSLDTDQRAKIVAYLPHEIYAVKTHYLVSTDIIFGQDEMVGTDDCHLGDASSWDIQTHKNHLYIKAKKLDAGGNLHVTTNKYTYHFTLSVSAAPLESEDQTLFLTFTYPAHSNEGRKLALALIQIPADICQDKSKYNLQYSFTGDREQAPIRACDDGLFTYFKFRRNSDLPAIFMVLPDRKEEVVNYRMENGYFVIERTAKAFTLRNGNVVTSVYNDKIIGDWDCVK